MERRLSKQAPKIVVVGSMNMDLMIRCDALPCPGETKMAQQCEEFCGGKGANQAVAAARAGGHVTMIGRVGEDGFGETMLHNLTANDVQTSSVIRTAACGSGMAAVMVEDSGQNSILVVPGANGRLTSEDVSSHAEIIGEADVVMLQLEVPLPTVQTVMEIANDADTKIILDPAPVIAPLPEPLFAADLFCPNESEAAALVGFDVHDLDSARRAAEALHDRGVPSVVVTLGDRGAWLTTFGLSQVFPAYPIDVLDTTAAGDAFAGALAVEWARTNDLAAATRYATAAGALAASKRGAQTGLPFEDDIQSLIRKHI